MDYKPSAARTVTVLPGAIPFETNGTFWNMTDPKKPRGLKDPNSTIDISLDWSKWLADIQDAAASFSWTVDNGASKVAEGVQIGVSTLFLALGNVGTTVAATCRITTASTPPRTEDRTVYLTIEDR